MKKKTIEDFIIKSLGELEEILPGKKINSLNSSTILFGPKGVLDSMGLVSLIAELEQKIEDELSISILLADERAMSQRNSPFRTVSSLAEYILELIKEEKLNE